MTRLPSLILSAILLAGLAIAGESEQPCAVLLDVLVHSADGPIHIENACLSAPVVYASSLPPHRTTMTISGIDFGNKIFRGDFEVWP
jgi:hypothetical protein